MLFDAFEGRTSIARGWRWTGSVTAALIKHGVTGHQLHDTFLGGSLRLFRDRLTQLAPVFLKNKYMLGDNFSMLDVAIAPLLWRLDYYGIDLSKNAAPLLKYAERIFSRPAYIEALTPSEKVMRK